MVIGACPKVEANSRHERVVCKGWKKGCWHSCLIILRASTYFHFLIFPSTIHLTLSPNDRKIHHFCLCALPFLFSIPASDMRGYTVLFPNLLLIYCRVLLADKSCYYPDQTLPLEPYYPCNTASGVHSACCASGDQCTEHGYCFGSAGYIYRGGCTDITWQSANCAHKCGDGTLSQPQEDDLLPRKIWLTL